MKLNIIDQKKKSQGKVDLPAQFDEDIRNDIIKRCVLAIQSNNRQSYGSKPKAGMRQSAELSRRRRAYRGSYGLGISRVPRKILLSRGTRMHWMGAVAPGTVGGRRAHPPKSEKKWEKKVNKKERKKGIRSALCATLKKDVVKQRGHRVPDNYPFAIDDKFESIEKTSDVKDALEKLGLKEELERCCEKKVRAGKGKSRGRKYKTKVGPLIVVSKECPLIRAASNIPGVDVVESRKLNAEVLAPGTHPGRLTIFTESALKEIEDKKLFT